MIYGEEKYFFEKYEIKLSESLGGEKKVTEILSKMPNADQMYIAAKNKGESITINGISASQINFSHGRLNGITLDQDFKINDFLIPKGSQLSLGTNLYYTNKQNDSRNNISSISPPRDGSRTVTYKGLVFNNFYSIDLKDEKELGCAFSNVEQKYKGTTFYKNQPICFDKNGEPKQLKGIFYRGQFFSFDKLQKNGEIPLKPKGVYGKDEYQYFVFTSEDIFGNSCPECDYDICIENNNFFVYKMKPEAGILFPNSDKPIDYIGKYFIYKNGNDKNPEIYDDDYEFVPCTQEKSYEREYKLRKASLKK